MRQEKIKHYLFDVDKKLSLYSELTLRMGLTDMLGRGPEFYQFATRASGKPYLQNQSNIYFNLSHTKNAILCSISRIAEIGVDIEQIQRIDYNLLNHIAHPEEKLLIQLSPKAQHDLLFYRMWTRKEAYCKRTGVGIRQKLDIINTTTCEIGKKYFTWQTDNYICSIYCEHNEQNFTYSIKEEDIRNFFEPFLKKH